MLHISGHASLDRYVSPNVTADVWEVNSDRCHLEQPWGSLTIRSDASYSVTSAASCIAIHDGRLSQEAILGRTEGNGSYIIFSCPEGPGEPFAVLTDRLGTIPLYYGEQHRRFVFASRLPTLMAAGFDQLDPTGASQMMLCGQPLGERTLLKGVHLLPPAAEVRLFAGSRASVRRYWLPVPNPEHAPPPHGAADDLLARLRAAHDRALPDGRALAMPVTGGLDSRLNLALHRDRLPSSILFHINLPRDPEGPIARRIARALDRPMVELNLDPARLAAELDHLASRETGEVSSAQLWLAGVGEFVSREAPSHTILDGYLQDALLNPRIATEHAREQLTDTLRMARNCWQLLGRPVQDPLLTEVLEEIDAAFGLEGADSALAASQRYYLDNRSRRFVRSTVRLAQNHVPVATPALDTELIDFAMALPWSTRQGGPLYRGLILRLAPDLAEVPYDKTGRPLKDGIRPTLRRRLSRSFYGRMNRRWPTRPVLRSPPSPVQLLLDSPQTIAHAKRLLDHSLWAQELTGSTMPGRKLLPAYPGDPRIELLLAALLSISGLERHRARQSLAEGKAGVSA